MNELVESIALKVQQFTRDDLERWVDVGGLQILVNVCDPVRSPKSLIEASVNALAHCAHVDRKFAVKTAECGGVTSLIKVCNSETTSLSVLISATSALFLLAFDPSTKEKIVKCEGTSLVVSLIEKSSDIRLLTWTVGILAALTFKNTPIISEVVASSESLIDSLLRLIIREDATVSSKTYAIGCIYNLSTNAEVQDDLMRLKAVDTFMDLCEGESNTVISGLAVRSLRLLASNKTYRSQMSDELVPRLIQICKTSTSREILSEAALTLASLVTNPATLQLAAKQGILHALQRTQIVLAVNTPEWLPKIIRKVETVLAIWRRKSGRALVLANPTSRSFAGTATPHQRYRPTYDVVEYFRDVGMSGVDDSFNFAKEKIPSGARRFSYGEVKPKRDIGTAAQAKLKIKEFILSVASDPSTDTLVLWLSGAGAEKSGALQLPGGSVSFDDIMELWSLYRPSKRSVLLFLLVDTCHSGAWVQAAKERSLKDVVVQSSCRESESSLEGAFSKWWSALQIRDVHALESLEALRLLQMHPQVYTPWTEFAPEQVLSIHGSPLWPLSRDSSATFGGKTPSSFSSHQKQSSITMHEISSSSSSSLKMMTLSDDSSPPSQDLSARLSGEWCFQAHSRGSAFLRFVDAPKEVEWAVSRGRLYVSIWLLGGQLQMEIKYKNQRNEMIRSNVVLEISGSKKGSRNEAAKPSSSKMGDGEYSRDEFLGLSCISRVTWDNDAILVHRTLIESKAQLWSRYTVTDNGLALLEELNAVAKDGETATATIIYERIVHEESKS